MATEITRRRKGKKFEYRKDGRRVRNRKELKRIEKLAIPPAWKDVTIAIDPSEKILAKGRDSADRQQAIYNPAFIAEQEAKKFSRISDFALQLPKLRKQIEEDLSLPGLPKEKVLACVVKLIDEAYFRVGNERYAKENETYGITTMRRKHLFVKGYTVTFDFMGKSGKHHHKSVTDRRLAYVIKQLDEQPGYEVFSYYDENKEKRAISSDKVNDYIKKHMGEEFSAKDFRTWGGTLIAIETLAAEKLAINEKDRKKAIYVCVKLVSQRLGNTPAVARNSYIDPEVFNSYMKGADFAKVKETISQMRPRKYLTSEERCALEVLNAVT